MSRSSVIPPAANVLEDEMRRNTFWIGRFFRRLRTMLGVERLTAYMTEPHFLAIHNFATFLDDQDIAQMLPVREDQFEQGVSVQGVA